jgi:hypothetical protein
MGAKEQIAKTLRISVDELQPAGNGYSSFRHIDRDVVVDYRIRNNGIQMKTGNQPWLQLTTKITK